MLAIPYTCVFLCLIFTPLLQHYFSQLITGIDETDEVWSRVQAKSQQCSKLQNELQKQKYR